MGHPLDWVCRFVAVGVVAQMLAGDVEAQRPPRADTIPRFSFAIDPAAIAAGLRPLRADSVPPGEREVRVWTGFGFGIPHTMYRLRTLGGNVRGTVILWWNHDSEWKPTDGRGSMHAYVARVYGCERIRRHEMVDACEGRFAGHPPDWRRVLAQMDSLGVNTLRTPSNNPVVTDGYAMVFETRDVVAYRTANFVEPSATGPGDTPRAAAILEVLQRIRKAAVRDSTSKRR
jgi:hypothetical protein